MIGFVFIFILINWLVINAGYYFYETNMLLGQYGFSSRLFASVQQILPAWLPIPFPSPFVTGLDMAKYYDQIGGGYPGISSFGKVTILGNESTGGSFWYYYLVSILFKTPIAYFGFLIAAIALYVRRATMKEFVRNEILLLLPPLYYLLVLSFFYNTQCGYVI